MIVAVVGLAWDPSLPLSLSPCFSLVHIVATVRDLFLHRHTRSRILAHTHTLNESLVITNRCYNHSILERVSVRQSQTRKKTYRKSDDLLNHFSSFSVQLKTVKTFQKQGRRQHRRQYSSSSIN